MDLDPPACDICASFFQSSAKGRNVPALRHAAPSLGDGDNDLAHVFGLEGLGERGGRVTMYCLEILRYIEDRDEARARGGIFEHVGYEHRVDPSTGHRLVLLFKTKKKAAQHYEENYGDAMRALNAHNTWKSDWHPVTKLAYAVREHHGVVAIPSQNIVF